MPKVKISEYSATANSNTDVASINIDEGCAPSGINNAIRAVMGHLKDFQQGTNGDPFNGPHNGTVGATTASTGAFTTLSATGDVSLGSGGTGTTTALLTINGGSGTGGRSRINFNTNGVGKNYVATAGAILGTTSEDLTLWSGSANVTVAASNAIMATFSSTGLAVTGTGSFTNIVNITRTGTTNLQLESPTGGSGISFRLAGVDKWGFGRGIVDNSNTLQWYDNDAGSTRMTLNASGKLLLGCTSDNGGLTQLQIAGSNTPGSSQSISFRLTDNGVYAGFRLSTAGNLCTDIYTGSAWVEATRIDSSGNLLMGTTSQIASGFVCLSFANNVRNGIVINDTDTGSGTSAPMIFRRNGSQVGSIVTTTSTTALVGTSDYRLKNSIVPMVGALQKVIALKPCTYKWNLDDSSGEGFIAHELQAVVPDAVIGEKDALNEDGSIKAQGINTSYLIATLTAAIQEQQALITQLTTRITALEGA